MAGPAFSIEDVRNIADEFDYHEIEHNEISKLLSFRGNSGPNRSTKINVYYTTGTVGTCLNHPTKGKTQLFRKNMNLSGLTLIFQNPRTHTGAGYYRKQISQRWKDSESGRFLTDSARRWQYVGSATGLIRNKQEMEIVVDMCTAWDELYWDPGQRPDLLETRCGCGSRCALIFLMCNSFRVTFGEFTVVRNNKDSEQSEMPYADFCDNASNFLRDHRVEVFSLMVLFKTLRKDLTLELMNWFLGRDSQVSFADTSGEIMTTSYTLPVRAAHLEYGNMMYPKKANMCSHCGVVRNGHK